MPQSQRDIANNTGDFTQVTEATTSPTVSPQPESGSIEQYLLELFGSSEPSNTDLTIQQPAPKQEVASTALDFEELLEAEPKATDEVLSTEAEAPEEPYPKLVETVPEQVTPTEELSVEVEALPDEAPSVQMAPPDVLTVEIPQSQVSSETLFVEVAQVEVPGTEMPVVEEPIVEEPIVEEPVVEEPSAQAPTVEAPVVELKTDEHVTPTQTAPTHVVSPVRRWRPIVVEGLAQQPQLAPIGLSNEATQVEEMLAGNNQAADTPTPFVEPAADDLLTLLSQVEIAQPATRPDDYIEPVDSGSLQESGDTDTPKDLTVYPPEPGLGPLLATQESYSQPESLGDTRPFHAITGTTQTDQQPSAKRPEEDASHAQSDEQHEYKPLLASQPDWGSTPTYRQSTTGLSPASQREIVPDSQPTTASPRSEGQDYTPQSEAPWNYNDPSRPRPKPGTPEYEEMVRQALEAQRRMPRNSQSTPKQPTTYAQGQSQAQSEQPSTYNDPNRPRPKPGTPEYEEMVREAMKQNQGVRTTRPLGEAPIQPTIPLPQDPPVPNPPKWPAEGAPKPKPGTPEYEAMVLQAMEEMKRKQREGES